MQKIKLNFHRYKDRFISVKDTNMNFNINKQWVYEKTS